MNDLSDLLPRAAGDDVPVGFDHADVRRRLRHRTRQRRLLALASIVAVIAIGVGVLARAGQGGGDEEGVYAHDGTGPVTAEELTSGPWLPVAVSRVATVNGQASLTFEPDGSLLLFDGDGCGWRTGRWTLDEGQLRVDDLVTPVDEGWAREADLPACPPDTVLVDILADDPTVGRPDPGLGTLALRATEEFAFFERFDRMGRIPTADDIAGPWTIGGGDDGWPFTFHPDGTVEGDERCPLRRSWSMDGDRLVIEDDGDDPEPGVLCVPLRPTDHDVFDGSTPARLGGVLPWDARLLLDVGGIVVAWERPASEAPGPKVAPHVGQPGESAKDVAERVAAVVLDDPAVTTGVEDAGTARIVTLESGSGSLLRAEVAYDATADTYRLERVTSPGLTAHEEGGQLTVTVPEPGRLLVTGHDDALSPPGEILVDRDEGVRGTTEPVHLPESSWLHVQLATTGGPVLHLLVPRYD